MLDELVLPAGYGWRKVKPIDEKFLERLFRVSRPHLTQIPLPAVFVDAMVRQQFEAQLASYRNRFPGAHHVLIMRVDQPVGRLMVDQNSENETLHVVDICLLPEECGKGVGTILLRALQSVAGRRDWVLRLSVDRHNWRASKLYASLGFQVAGRSATHNALQWGVGTIES